MDKFDLQVNALFNRVNKVVKQEIPRIIAEEAVTHFQRAFIVKSWDGINWSPTKKPVSRGSLMLRTEKLRNSIYPSLITAEKITVSTGRFGSVPYARVHNEGGLIIKKARTENFVRNYKTKPNGMRRFIKGKSEGQGFTFKAHSFSMPRRQFMGKDKALIVAIKSRINRDGKNNFTIY